MTSSGVIFSHIDWFVITYVGFLLLPEHVHFRLYIFVAGEDDVEDWSGDVQCDICLKWRWLPLMGLSKAEKNQMRKQLEDSTW